MMHLLVGGFGPLRHGSLEHESIHLDQRPIVELGLQGSVSAAPRAIFDEDPDHTEPPPMHRSKSSLGAQSRGI